MADLLSILCPILTITDAFKKILDICSEYVAHAKNAPKELQTLIEDVHALNGTMKRLGNLAKSAKPTPENAQQIDQWKLPLARINLYAKDLVQLIIEQDMKVGLLHELRFRARWAYSWRDAARLLALIGAERNTLQFETRIYGTEMLGTLVETTDERLPRTIPPITPGDSHHGSNILVRWEKVDEKLCSRDQRETLILNELGPYLDWPQAKYEYHAIDDSHQASVHDSTNYPKEKFLESRIYQSWKNRRTRGPGLLCATGEEFRSVVDRTSATTGKTTLCCRVIQDLQNSNSCDCGVAYYYFRGRDHVNPYTVTQVIQFWIIQLALQLDSLPSALLSEAVTLGERHNLPQLDTDLHGNACLLPVLKSLFTKFKRTFLLLDGLDTGGVAFPENLKAMVKFLQEVLEPDFDNVSIAIFSEPVRGLEPLLQLADVSIRITRLDPDLSEYIRFKVSHKVKPMLAEANLDHDEDALAVIEKVVAEASIGLYLGVDVLTDSLVTAIRAGRNITAFLQEVRENNEIMLQREPESMKQKAFGVETRTPIAGVEGSSKRTH